MREHKLPDHNSWCMGLGRVGKPLVSCLVPGEPLAAHARQAPVAPQHHECQAHLGIVHWVQFKTSGELFGAWRAWNQKVSVSYIHFRGKVSNLQQHRPDWLAGAAVGWCSGLLNQNVWSCLPKSAQLDTEPGRVLPSQYLHGTYGQPPIAMGGRSGPELEKVIS